MDGRERERELKRQAEAMLNEPKQEVFSRGTIETDSAGIGGAYGMIQGNQVMDKRICQKILHQRAHILEQQAQGVRRLADLVVAAGDHDYALFSLLIGVANLNR